MKHFSSSILLIAIFFTQSALAFIPPVRAVVEEIFSNRRSQPVLEAVVQHKIQLSEDETVNVEERLVREQGTVRTLWSFSDYPQTVSALWSRQNYTLHSGAVYPSRSGVFLKYLFEHSPDEFLRQLLLEQFVRKDQLQQFKASYDPTGDPSTWGTKENYELHPDIFLFRMPMGIAIAVNGLNEGAASKTVYFDEAMKGVSRIEWKQGELVTAWNFYQFSKMAIPGYFPRQMAFVLEGVERISSSLVALRSVKSKEIGTFRRDIAASQSEGSLPDRLDRALKMLLSFR